MTLYIPRLTLLIALALALHSFPKQALSTSRRALDHHPEPRVARVGIRVALRHVDHGSNYTKLERVRRGVERGTHRLQRLNAMAALASGASGSYDLQTKVRPGKGEFLMSLAVGSPPNPFSAIMDTGSDLVWTQCKPCQECFDQPTPIFDPQGSSTFSKMPCSSQLCEALPTSSCGDDEGCQYMYTYGDYSSSQGILATETFTFGSGNDKVSVPGLGFGCGEDNEGNGFGQGSGLVGLGRGPLSLVSQLDEPKFSYCLTSIVGSQTSTLLMGSLASANHSSLSSNKGANILTTPLVKNPSQPSFYYLNLEGISVGPARLPTEKDPFALGDDGSGGLIIDSGTTITYLEQASFDLLKKEFTSQMKLPLDKPSSTSSGLDLCFKMPKDTSDLDVPRLVFHFQGADLELPTENYMIGDPSLGVLCLAMGGSSGMSIFGNVQQQNMMVVHDLAMETLSFVPTQCDAL